MNIETKDIFQERPSNPGNPGNPPGLVKDKSDKNHYEYTFDKSFMTQSEDIIEISHPDLGCIGYLRWIGQDENGNMVYQPGIRSVLTDDDLYLAFDGEVIHQYRAMPGKPSKSSLIKEDVFMPNDGSLYKMTPNKVHYFNKTNILSPDLNHCLNVNNASIEMDNVSIYNKDIKGCSFTFRFSFDGSISSEEIGGKISVLCSITTIG